MPHCSEALDAISRYIYAGLQKGGGQRRALPSLTSKCWKIVFDECSGCGGGPFAL